MMSFSDAIDTASERHMEHILPRKLTEPKNRGLEDVFPSRSMMFRFHISFPGVGCIEIESLHWKKIKIYQLSDIFFLSFNPPKQDRFQKRQGVIWVPGIHICCFLFEFVWEGYGCIHYFVAEEICENLREKAYFIRWWCLTTLQRTCPRRRCFYDRHGQNETYRIVFTNFFLPKTNMT